MRLRTPLESGWDSIKLKQEKLVGRHFIFGRERRYISGSAEQGRKLGADARRNDFSFLVLPEHNRGSRP